MSLDVMEVGFEQARHLIMAVHYAHRMPMIQRAFALMEDSAMVGVVTFGQPATPWVKVSMFGQGWQGEILELNRLVIITHTKNAASFLVGSAIRRLGKTPLVSYADQGAGHVGYIYQATNWKYSGQTVARTDVASEDGKHERWNKDGDKSVRRDRSQKHRYWFCRDKNLSKLVQWESLPYPKGETSRHIIQANDSELFS